MLRGSFKFQWMEFGVHMPKSAETFRSRIKLLVTGFEFARITYSSRRAIATTSLDLWNAVATTSSGARCGG